MKFNKEKRFFKCYGNDWVTCYVSKCRPSPEILKTVKNIKCTYREIIYTSEMTKYYGSPTVVEGDNEYILTGSDHVSINCTGYSVSLKSELPNNTTINFIFGPSSWSGLGAGFRSTVDYLNSDDNYDVLILSFDSTSKNAFIRNMPESYEFLTKQLNATVLNKYNILGDGMPAALFPILSGKTEFELPDAKKRVPGSGFMDETQFIFHRVKKIGYQAAYFEDLLRVYSGTYQYRFNGFRRQPADHYLSHLLREDQSNEFCFGGAPRFQFMMNLTEQFFELPGKHFIFTLISDITHNDINYLHNADKPLVEVLERLEKQGTFQNTLLIVMGDHGSRIKRFRYTYQAKLEERLPFMAIRLPDKLKAAKPIAQKALQGNVDVLTTAHDIHATILDIVGLKKYLNPYKVKGADLPRAMSLIRKVPRNRSCSEAGIEPHWCTCLRWEELAPADSMYERAARAVVNHINHITKSMRNICVLHSLLSVQWVLKRQANTKFLQHTGAYESIKFTGQTESPRQVYQVKITTSPNHGIYEATLSYIKMKNKFVVSSSDIYRINRYKDDAKCINDIHSHLKQYCYCNS